MGWIKINVDGVANGNPRSVGCGGLARNHMGLLVSAVALPQGTQSNHFAEANATHIGLHMAKREGFCKVWLECALLNTINCLNGCTDPRWTIATLIKDCRDIINELKKFKILHVFREGNKATDLQANMVVGYVAAKWWSSRDSLPKNLWELACDDSTQFQ
ncbi:uncharacterized protein LOC131043737 [Cryptomeria japonica]|uniref:uncharacterized protein LOC131043737 n=1 Tax=Cryptomeria japonica TaxID=3369 RepID=UPI0025AD3195|nr:uncharacterized protein LOC131043737 [Cryptomeria japonica]